MRWRRGGQIYVPDGSLPWARHHAFPPTPYKLDDERLRIYFSSLDDSNVGRLGFVDVLCERPSEVVGVSPEPILDVGEPGCFDDNGLLPTCVLPVGDELWLYYTGYQLGSRVKYFQFLGLAVSTDGGDSFTRRQRVPVLDRSDAETLTRASAFVSLEAGVFTMYYSAGSGWTESPAGKALPVYNVRRLESSDGITWGSEGLVCIDFATPEEHGIARPWVMRRNNGYEMLFSYRTRTQDYRLGYAVSRDGREWERRDDDVGIGPSGDGRSWDSEAVAYGSLVESAGTAYLFYCGNERGGTGFGYAELEAG